MSEPITLQHPDEIAERIRQVVAELRSLRKLHRLASAAYAAREAEAVRNLALLNVRCSMPGNAISPGLTPRELARLLRVSPDKVRGWIDRGELKAINTASRTCAKPRFIVLPGALDAFLAGRQAGKPTPAPKAKRRTTRHDYYPD